MKKIFFSLVAGFALCTGLFAAEAQKIRLGVLNGPSCIPAGYLLNQTAPVKGAELSFEKFADPQALLPKIIKKEVDLGFMPLNVAAKVYNSGNKVITCTAVTGLGNLKLITTDENIRRFSDLKEKTVYIAGQGATPEYMFSYLLTENGMTYAGEKPDLTLDFSVPTAQLAAQLLSGKIQYALVPEPFATIAQMKSDKVRAALDLQKEYIEVTGEKEIYPLTVMVVRTDFAKENPELLLAFLSEYKKAVSWTISNPSQAGKLSQKHNLGLSSDIVEKSIPLSNYTFVSASDAKKSMEILLNLFLENNKASIGEKLPDQDFYFKED